MEETKEIKRIDSVDILRAVGIIVMVMGHVGFGGKFDRFIHTFHMPLFFLISGYLYRQKLNVSIGRQIASKAKRLMIPYVMYGVINYIFWLLLVKTSEDLWWSPLLRMVTYNTEKLPICGALWFLSSMFFAETIYIVLDRILKKNYVRTIVVLLVAIGTSFAENATGYRLPLAIDTSLVCMGFLEIGRLYKLYKDTKEQKTNRPSTIFFSGLVLLACNGVLAFVNDYVNIKSGWYGIVPLFWLNAVVGTFALALLVKWFTGVSKDNNRFRNMLSYIGRNSMVFLGLNQFVILVVSMLYSAVGLPGNMYISGAVVLIITLVLLYVICVVIDLCKNKTLKMFFGI